MTTSARTARITEAGRTAKPLSASRALRIGGRANLVIAAVHVIGLIWAWSFFRSVGVEHEMREVATQGAALPYIARLVTAAAFAVIALLIGLFYARGVVAHRRLGPPAAAAPVDVPAPA